MAMQALPPEEGDLSSNPTPERQGGMSRRSLVRAGLVTGAVVAPMGIMAAVTQAHRATTPLAPVLPATKPQTRLGPLQSVGASASQFVEIQKDENAHVSFLQSALKSSARPKPTFKGLDAADINTFAKMSMTFENLGVGAYLMAAPAISSKDILAAAGSILTIEARHAGFLDVLLGAPISANGAFDKPIPQADIVTAVTPFVASLNGGPNPAGKLASDTDILNFALLLEFLEAEFYNLNVPKFFGTAGQG